MQEAPASCREADEEDPGPPSPPSPNFEPFSPPISDSPYPAILSTPSPSPSPSPAIVSSKIPLVQIKSIATIPKKTPLKASNSQRTGRPSPYQIPMEVLPEEKDKDKDKENCPPKKNKHQTKASDTRHSEVIVDREDDFRMSVSTSGRPGTSDLKRPRENSGEFSSVRETTHSKTLKKGDDAISLISTRSFVQTSYSSADLAPFIVHIRSTDNADSNLHPLTISKKLSLIAMHDLLRIKKLGRSQLSAEFKTASAANKVIADSSLPAAKLNAYIPSYRSLRVGVIKDIPVDMDRDELIRAIESPYKVLDIYRLNRRVRIENEVKYVPSKTICVKFAGQVLPKHVALYRLRHEVYPYIPKVKICFSCFRVGHIGKWCKSKPRCARCGKDKHDSENSCPLINEEVSCINCGGPHFPTSHSCPLVADHKSAQALAATENIPFIEAKQRIKSVRRSTIPRDIVNDFRNFPLARETDEANNFPLSNNRFAGLMESDEMSRNNNRRPTYANVTARSATRSGPSFHSPSQANGSQAYAKKASSMRSAPLDGNNKRYGISRDHYNLLLAPNGRHDYVPDPNLNSHTLQSEEITLKERGAASMSPIRDANQELFERLQCCLKEFTALSRHLAPLCQSFNSSSGNRRYAGHNQEDEIPHPSEAYVKQIQLP